MVRIRFPESVSISVRELPPLLTTQSKEPVTTAASGSLNREGPFVLHIIHVTAGDDGDDLAHHR